MAWAGEHESLNWFDTAREYTEKWVHQQQIRDAAGRPGFTSHKWLHPALDTFLCGLAHTFREADAPSGTVVSVNISGRPGGTWSLARKAQRWELYVGAAQKASASVQIDQDTAWRVFAKGISPAQAQARSRISGDARLGRRVPDLVAIMA